VAGIQIKTIIVKNKKKWIPFGIGRKQDRSWWRRSPFYLTSEAAAAAGYMFKYHCQ
jgi:hypothetical protein